MVSSIDLLMAYSFVPCSDALVVCRIDAWLITIMVELN